MRKVSRLCLHEGCPEARKGMPISHTIHGIQAGESTTFGNMVDQLQIRCDTCGHETLESIPKTRVRKRGWPYHNESVGVTFQSDSHEKQYVKKHNLDAM